MFKAVVSEIKIKTLPSVLGITTALSNPFPRTRVATFGFKFSLRSALKMFPNRSAFSASFSSINT